MRSDRLYRWIAALILLLLVVAPLFSDGVALLVDWLWFRQQGFRIIYLTILKAQVGLSGYCGYSQVIEFPALDRLNTLFRGLIWFSVLIIGYFVGEWASGHWKDYLLAAHPIHMAESDPIFGIGLSFYFFKLPFIWFLYHF